MAIVAGVDFGTLSIRVTIVDTDRGRLGSGVAEFPLQRKKDDPDYATQSHTDHMRALAEAMRKAVSSAKSRGYHRYRAPRKAGSDRVVRRGLFLRVGLLETSALASPQFGEARAFCHGVRTLRHGRGSALRHHRSSGGSAVGLRDGP